MVTEVSSKEVKFQFWGKTGNKMASLLPVYRILNSGFRSGYCTEELYPSGSSVPRKLRWQMSAGKTKRKEKKHVERIEKKNPWLPSCRVVSSIRSLSLLIKFPGIGTLIICLETQLWPSCSPVRHTHTIAVGLEASL